MVNRTWFMSAGNLTMLAPGVAFLFCAVAITVQEVTAPDTGIPWWAGVLLLGLLVLGYLFSAWAIWRGCCCWVVVSPNRRRLVLGRGRRVAFDEIESVGIVVAPPTAVYDREVPFVVLRSGKEVKVSELMTRVGSRVNERFLECLMGVLPSEVRFIDGLEGAGLSGSDADAHGPRHAQ